MTRLGSSIADLIAALDALDFDGEVMHSEADNLVIGWMAASQTTALRDIAAAYGRVKDRAEFWAWA